jgi:hypothetical protein
VTETAIETAATVEHAVTPLELFFDLVFVFAITQVTTLLTHDPSWHGVIRGALALAAVWWAWTGYAWLTSTLNVDEGGVDRASRARVRLTSARPSCAGRPLDSALHHKRRSVPAQHCGPTGLLHCSRGVDQGSSDLLA